MNTPILSWTVAMLASVAMLAWSVPAGTRARAGARAQLGRLAQVRQHAEAIDGQGRARRQVDANASLAEEAGRALAEAGLDASLLVALSPGQGVLVSSNPPVTLERATLRWEGLTLPQLGRLLDHWRSAAPGWTITTIEVAPDREGNVRPGEDLPLQVVMEAQAWSAREKGPQ
jgi:hypothetical protein